MKKFYEKMLRVFKNKVLRHPSLIIYLALSIALMTYIEKRLNKPPIDNSMANTTKIEPQLRTTPQPHLASSFKLKYKVGHVNVHLWYKVCSSTVDSLRQLPVFPLWPSIRGQPEMPNELVSIMSSRWSAQRVMGLLYPPVSGTYRFELSSGSLSEFWLSRDEKPENAVFIAKVNKNRLFGVQFTKDVYMPNSKPINLEKDRVYYFEMIHAMNDITRDQVQVRWLLPGTTSYTPISNTSISTVIKNDTSLDVNTRSLVTSSPSLDIQILKLKRHKPHKWSNVDFSKAFGSFPSYTRDNVYSLEYGDTGRIMEVFEECEYSPSYTKRKTFKRYQGVYYTHFDHVFPNDQTDGKIWQGFHENADRQGNKLIEEGVVVNVVGMFMRQLNTSLPGEYKLANVVNVERNVDEVRGNRYFLELVLQETKTNKLQRFSEYLYQFIDKSTVLCKPRGLTWSPKTRIYAVITTKSQGPWVIHYIKNMARAIHANKDDNVHFVIVDYGNNGVNIEDELKRNNLKHHTIIKKDGKFHKTLAIDEAVKTINDSNSIVFLTDLHLDVPKDFFEIVRKHTIQGYMTFTPVVFRLKHCGRPETDQTSTTGYWDSYAFGIYSSFRSDWDHFGGVNVKEFKYKWGGEDWEMVDRVLAKGLEINRLRLPFFYHFFHDKIGMWEKS